MFNKKELEAIRNYLLKKEETIAVAESVTSGFLQAAFSTVPDAAKFFHGGITAYNLGQKARHLHVNPIHAESCNCVSEQVAQTMALEVCNVFGSHWGVAVTGYATKVPESGQQLYAWCAVAYKQKIVLKKHLKTDTAEGEETQLFYVGEAIKLLRKKTGSPAEKTKKKTA